ncbi:hypothetical protein JR316_0006562 [Psilocybe cubensis]|uniref:Uncharacterized protein n=2 Tax=Psilocybe cubensis TaxID=181762 RepID=A0A8H7XKI8_PSICU|nr:hypothetical protein JR316_0006562 [Psilocybe cubensis]KAH9482032.1 hypothetical protein JR316_0006562 [Psilocybe cubensis]
MGEPNTKTNDDNMDVVCDGDTVADQRSGDATSSTAARVDGLRGDSAQNREADDHDVVMHNGEDCDIEMEGNERDDADAEMRNGERNDIDVQMN